MAPARSVECGSMPSRSGRPSRRCRCLASRSAGAWSERVIGLPAGVKVFLACGRTDMRKGMNGLAMQVQTVLEKDPFSGHVFCFRGRRGDLIKALYWDTQGLCLFAKRLEKGRFIWPSPADGVVRLTAAQLSMLLEGIDWRGPRGALRAAV